MLVRWLDQFDEKAERSPGRTIELSSRFGERVVMKGGVLSINRACFDVTAGYERSITQRANTRAR